MKILYVCHRFPFPPKRGGKIRPFNMIRHFAKHHEVTVASLARSPEEAEQGKGIEPFCARFEMALVNENVQRARMVARLISTEPSSMGYFYSQHLARRVREMVAQEQFDLIFVHCSSVAQYVSAMVGVPKILDFGDMDSQKWLEYSHYKPFPLSLGYRLEGMKMQFAEKRLAARFDMCTATTRAEWETLESYGTGAATDWFPNGVDSNYFAPSDDEYDPDLISFVGRMDYYPNQECMLRFCRETLPVLRKLRPTVKLSIVGAEPSPEIVQLGEISGVTVTGTVPDVRAYVQRSVAMVAPLNIARGTQNKILESMAMGVPVVTSSVAAGGVDAVAGQHLLVADSPEETASALSRLMSSSDERRRLAIEGRNRVLTHHAWDRSMERLDHIVERCFSAYRGASAASLRPCKDGMS